MSRSCEWCGAPLPDAATHCSRCGKEAAPAAPAKAKKRSRALFFTLVAILLLLLAALAIAWLLQHLAPPTPPATSAPPGAGAGAGAEAPPPSPVPSPIAATPPPPAVSTPSAATRGTLAAVSVSAGTGLSGLPIVSGESPLASVQFSRIGAPPREVVILIDGAPNWTMHPSSAEQSSQAILIPGSVGTHTAIARDTDTGDEVATSFRVAWDRLTVATIPANATAGSPVTIATYLKIGDGLPADWRDAIDVYVDGALAGSTDLPRDAGFHDASVAITPSAGAHTVRVQLRSDPQDALSGPLTAS